MRHLSRTRAREANEEKWRGFLRGRLRGLGVADQDLDDATQDVFEVMVRRIADYDPEQIGRAHV